MYRQILVPPSLKIEPTEKLFQHLYKLFVNDR